MGRKTREKEREDKTPEYTRCAIFMSGQRCGGMFGNDAEERRGTGGTGVTGGNDRPAASYGALDTTAMSVIYCAKKQKRGVAGWLKPTDTYMHASCHGECTHHVHTYHGEAQTHTNTHSDCGTMRFSFTCTWSRSAWRPCRGPWGS